GPLSTHGASRRSWRKVAMKVWVLQWPKGAWSTSRSPRGAHPRVLHMLVFRDVSSMKPRRGRKLRMKGWRWRIQHCLASHTSDRFCSTARRSFFICQAKTLKKTADGRALDLDPMVLAQGDNQFIKRRVLLPQNVGADPRL